MKKIQLVVFIVLANCIIDAAPLTVGDGVASWGPEISGMGEFLRFESDSYTFAMEGPGGMTCTGKYSVKGPSIHLLQGTTDHNDSVNCSPKQCQIKTTDTSLSKTRYILCGSKKYWSSYKQDAVKLGSKRKVNNQSIITVNKLGTINADAIRMRLGPGIAHKLNHCKIMDGMDGQPKKATLNTGDEVFVVARTLEKQKVGKMNAYWYYVQKEQSDYSFCDKEFFWLYSHFVDLKE